MIAHLADLLIDRAGAVCAHGWSPGDLAEVVQRRLGPSQVPHLLSVLGETTRSWPAGQVSDAWQQDLSGAGPAYAVDLGTSRGLVGALSLAALLVGLPPITPVLDPPGRVGHRRTPVDAADAKVLARVRALLAKAESTEFPEEAEALSTKAQELISRHALDALLALAPAERSTDIVAIRIWIEPPYVLAKAHLVHAVASANRCKAVLMKELEFSTVMGTPSDLASVELLTTSLLVQASAAMLRHGAQVDRHGRSRTASFRQSFLISYAGRIGERLAGANDLAAEGTGRAGELVTVLRRHEERVEEAARQAMPHTRTARTASVSNHAGYVAGRAAADQARLDPRERLTG